MFEQEIPHDYLLISDVYLYQYHRCSYQSKHPKFLCPFVTFNSSFPSKTHGKLFLYAHDRYIGQAIKSDFVYIIRYSGKHYLCNIHE